MTYEDNKKKRSTLPVVGIVRSIASDLCLMGGAQCLMGCFIGGVGCV